MAILLQLIRLLPHLVDGVIQIISVKGRHDVVPGVRVRRLGMNGIERALFLLREMLHLIVQLFLLIGKLVGLLLRLRQLLLLCCLILLARLLALHISDAIGQLGQVLGNLLRLIVPQRGIVLQRFLQLLHGLALPLFVASLLLRMFGKSSGCLGL